MKKTVSFQVNRTVDTQEKSKQTNKQKRAGSEKARHERCLLPKPDDVSLFHRTHEEEGNQLQYAALGLPHTCCGVRTLLHTLTTLIHSTTQMDLRIVISYKKQELKVTQIITESMSRTCRRTMCVAGFIGEHRNEVLNKKNGLI